MTAIQDDTNTNSNNNNNNNNNENENENNNDEVNDEGNNTGLSVLKHLNGNQECKAIALRRDSKSPQSIQKNGEHEDQEQDQLNIPQEPTLATTTTTSTNRLSTLFFWNQPTTQPPAVDESPIIEDEESSTVKNDINGVADSTNTTEEQPTQDQNQAEPEPEQQPQEQPNPQTQPQPQEPDPETNNPNDTSGQWWSQFQSINSVVAYVNNLSQEVAPTEQTPLLSANSNTTDASQQQPTGQSWWDWVWTRDNGDNEDEYDASHTSNLQYFKAAKQAIETAKEVSHYAFKSSFTNHINTHTKEVELAVVGTMTETQPVRYHSRKEPLLPNEVQEKSLRNRPGSSSASSMLEGNSNSSGTPKLSSKVAPHFEDNYRTRTWKTKLRILSQDVVCSLKKENHLYKQPLIEIRNNKRRKLNKIVIISIHGFLPTKFVRAIIGQNTGNSIRFATHASKAVLKWLSQDNPGFKISDYDIETIALEGEGKINDRVEKLYKLLDNWMDMLDKSDFIFFISHGQATPVAINLMAKLLHEHLHWHYWKKLGLLSMSGLQLGPFMGLDTKIVTRAFTSMENEIIRELFEFQKPYSKLSLQLNESMKILMKNNVKVTFSASVTDQFIPLSSSLALQFAHPNIHRNIFQAKSDIQTVMDTTTPSNVSDSSNAPFLTNLLIIICMMKNVGKDFDYNIIRELSDKFNLEGTPKGHCKLFDDEQVYMESIQYCLETTDLIHSQELSINILKPLDSASFHSLLPWNIRSLFQDLVQIKHIGSVKLIEELLFRFKAWQPTPKQWKDIKYCLDVLNDFEIEDLFL